MRVPFRPEFDSPHLQNLDKSLEIVELDCEVELFLKTKNPKKSKKTISKELEFGPYNSRMQITDRFCF